MRKPDFKGLKLYCLDVNSFVKHLDELRLLVDDKQPHVLCPNETKLDDTVEDNCIDIDWLLGKTEQDMVVGLPCMCMSP